jgi:hypothetical protein
MLASKSHVGLALTVCVLTVNGNSPGLQDKEQKVQTEAPTDSKLQKLLQARVEAAKSYLDIQLKLYDLGHPRMSPSLDSIFDVQRPLALAEFEATNNKADQVKALERYFAGQKEHERINQERYKNEAISIQDLNYAKYYRLEAELWLERAKAGSNNIVRPANTESRICRELLKERMKVAKAEMTGRIELFKRALIDERMLTDLISPSQRLLLTELQASENEADQLEALKAHLQRMKTIEEINQGALDAGRITKEMLLESKYFRLDGAIRLEQHKAKPHKKDTTPAENNNNTDSKLPELIQARLEVAKAAADGFLKRYQEGSAPIGVFLDSSRRLLIAEVEATPDKTKQSAALQAHLERTKKAEEIGLDRFKAGTAALTDSLQAKYHRLNAEIWLERFRAGKLNLEDISIP